MAEMTPEMLAYKRDRMADFFVRCANGWMTHELFAEHLMEALAGDPGRTYEITLARLYEKVPTKAALDDFARKWGQDMEAMMSRKGHGGKPVDAAAH